MEQRVVTILGGTGFLGHYVVQQLAKAGYRIRVVSRNPDAGQDLITYGDVGQIALLPGNITEPASYSGALKGSYAVINLVGILYEKGKQRFSEIHSLGAEKLAVAAKEAGAARFIHISALGVENECGSGYARSKILGERAVISAFPEATIIRPGIMFGAEDNFYNKFAKMAQISPLLPLIGGGKTLFQPVYVADVAAAIVVCLEKSETKGQTYELGGPDIYSFRQIMEYILAVTGKRRLLVPVPFGLAYLLGRFAEFYPKPILTRDQVKILKHDNNVNPTAKSFALLGIKPTAVEIVAPEYLSIYHKKAAA
jgi:NADH dehydrogenase